MNANRLVRMVVNMLLRHGVRRLNKGQKIDPRAKQAQKTLRTVRRIGRM